jgi:hypothetical protein
MTKVSRWAVTAGVLAAALSVSVLAFQGVKSDPVIGTWTLNVAKSKFEPGPAAKSGTVTFMAAGDGVHVVADIAYADSTIKTDYTANYDRRQLVGAHRQNGRQGCWQLDTQGFRGR